jgi:hypothetical protein
LSRWSYKNTHEAKRSHSNRENKRERGADAIHGYQSIFRSWWWQHLLRSVNNQSNPIPVFGYSVFDVRVFKTSFDERQEFQSVPNLNVSVSPRNKSQGCMTFWISGMYIYLDCWFLALTRIDDHLPSWWNMTNLSKRKPAIHELRPEIRTRDGVIKMIERSTIRISETCGKSKIHVVITWHPLMPRWIFMYAYAHLYIHTYDSCYLHRLHHLHFPRGTQPQHFAFFLIDSKK